MALEGRCAIVTGGGSGIGAATASLLAANGVAVLIADIDVERAEVVAHGIVSAGGRAEVWHTDVGQEVSVRAAVDAADRLFGRLDILHNNAGAVDGATFSRDGGLLELDVDVWDRMMAINVRGPMLGCKHAIPLMLRGGGGAIVNTASAAALAGNVRSMAYAASKSALITLTKYVATAFGHQGVRCNAVAPGVILTPAVAENVSEVQMDLYKQNVLVPRLGMPEDIAQAVLYLAGDTGAYINGQTLVVDGGLLAHMPYVAQARLLAQRVEAQ
jgi:NAD(P)-dependent dehydrogenase (short-subunit alcohol dehydrogenase family)